MDFVTDKYNVLSLLCLKYMEITPPNVRHAQNNRYQAIQLVPLITAKNSLILFQTYWWRW